MKDFFRPQQFWHAPLRCRSVHPDPIRTSLHLEVAEPCLPSYASHHGIVHTDSKTDNRCCYPSVARCSRYYFWNNDHFAHARQSSHYLCFQYRDISITFLSFFQPNFSEHRWSLDQVEATLLHTSFETSPTGLSQAFLGCVPPAFSSKKDADISGNSLGRAGSGIWKSVSSGSFIV